MTANLNISCPTVLHSLHQSSISLTLLFKFLILMQVILHFIPLTFLLRSILRVFMIIFLVIAIFMMILHCLFGLFPHVVMEDSVEEALVFMGRRSFGLCK